MKNLTTVLIVLSLLLMIVLAVGASNSDRESVVVQMKPGEVLALQCSGDFLTLHLTSANEITIMCRDLVK